MKCPLTIAAMITLATAVAAFAIPTNTSNVYDPEAARAEKAAAASGVNIPEPHVAGENCANATAIATIPYYDVGNTCAFAHDYTGLCAIPNTAPDFVYRYTPGSNQIVRVSLCGSSYDTEVIVYEPTCANEVACNDDWCGLSSEVQVSMVAGHTYYIVVDGYLSACGDYTLSLLEVPTPSPNCPPAQIEGEPVCGPNYQDHFNGGCNSIPPVFSSVMCQTICGESGTYLSNGLQYRDTDWYQIDAYAPSSWSGHGDGFPLRLSVLTPTCPPAVLMTTVTPPYVESELLRFGPGTFYLFVAPDVFAGVPCRSTYVLHIYAGIICELATEKTSWGAVKSLFR